MVPNNKKNSVKALFNPAGLKLTNLREKKLITSNKSLQKDTSFNEIEERYGNFRVIKPTREEALMRMTH